MRDARRAINPKNAERGAGTHRCKASTRSATSVGPLFQAVDAFLERWMVGKESQKAVLPAGNLQGLKGRRTSGFRRRDLRLIKAPQGFQGIDHRLPPRQARAAGVGPE